MKFRVVVIVFTIVIIGLFTQVYRLTNNLQKTLAKNDSLLVQNEAHLKSLEAFKKSILEQDMATDSISFNVAKKSNTLEAYKFYLEQFGQDGEYYAEALADLNNLFNKDGYVQIVESNGRKNFAVYDDTKGFPPEAVMIGDTPSVSGKNLFVSKMAMNVRRGIIGKDDDYRKKGNISSGQLVKMDLNSKYTFSNGAQWARIMYTE
ncbi:MAG: hypothetical protein KJO20_01975 [Eudoraea sp.]|nr:hypothetical protein [Eudoraea sp.]MBT8320862.1 hypothetical protein [Eudoraea sp.]